MLQIENHEDKALEVIVPYLHQFPEIIGLAKNSGTRAQHIEDVAWELLWDLNIETAEGVWLDYLGVKVGQPRTFAPPIEGAFTFGGTPDEGFGAGKFLSGALTGSNTKITRSDGNFRQAIKSKIIENNTDCSLDELKNACKLLYNASKVLITENYPAGISSVHIYGSSLLQSRNANSEIKAMIPAGVSLTNVYFTNAYNLFKNNAFISYSDNYTIPESDDFELSFSFVPDTLGTGNAIPLLSESTSFSQIPIVNCYYTNSTGIHFETLAENYTDGLGLIYTDGNGEPYYSGESDLSLSGGNVLINKTNVVKVTKVGTNYSLYLNNTLIDTDTSTIGIGGGPGYNLYVGALSNTYYNSGSIYNLYIYNSTSSSIVLNDPLKLKTLYGINNGVIFI